MHCQCGQPHWGQHGAAGLLLVRPGQPHEVLLQLRAQWTHQGGCWGIPGGALDSHETAIDAAIREACEETGIPAEAFTVVEHVITTDHSDWRYTVVVARADDPSPTIEGNSESDALTWTASDRLPDLNLHPGLAASWPDLHRLVSRVFGPE